MGFQRVLSVYNAVRTFGPSDDLIGLCIEIP